MQKSVVLSSFSLFSIMKFSSCGIIVESIIELTVLCIGWIDLWFVCFQIWICMYVILQHVIFE